MQRLAMELTGMGCSGCVENVRRALGKLAGVSIEDVQIGSAAVRYEPERVSPMQVFQALQEAGYAVKSSTSVPLPQAK
jgi:copper chaperone CopZ